MRYHAHILVADPDNATTSKIVTNLNESGYKASSVNDVGKLVSTIEKTMPNLIIIGNFQGQQSLDIAEKLNANQNLNNIPVFLYDCEADSQYRKRSIAAGVEDMIEAPLPVELVIKRLPALARISTIKNELNLRVETANHLNSKIEILPNNNIIKKLYRVMIVAQSSAAEADIQTNLLKRNIDTLMEINAFNAADRLDQKDCEACIITLRPEDDGDRALFLCRHIRNNPRLFNLPVLILAPKSIYKNIDEIYKSGANIALIDNRDLDLIGTYIEILVASQRARMTMRQSFSASLNDKTCDNIDQIYSREFFENHLQRVVDNCQSRNSYMSLCIFSIKNAPDILQRFGDESHKILLKQMASWIKGLLRIEDTVARIGNDDFAVILTGSEFNEASAVCNRIAGILHHSEFHLTEEVMEIIKVWVEVGIVEIKDDDNATTMLKHAYNNLR